MKLNDFEELLASLNATFDISAMIISENFIEAKALFDSLQLADGRPASKLTVQFESLSLKGRRVVKRLSIKVLRHMRQAIKSHSEEPAAKPKQVFESLVKEAFTRLICHDAETIEEPAFYEALRVQGVRKGTAPIESLSLILDIGDDKQLQMSKLIQLVAAMLTSELYKRIKSRVSFWY